MTKDKRAKRDARERREATGERYTTARRNTATGDIAKPRFEPDHCASCMQPLPVQIQGLFCSELCTQTASTIRYWRGVMRDGRIKDPDVKRAVETKVAHLLAGGYRRQARRLPEQLRSEIRDRDKGACQQCGKPGAEIDHIDGESPDLSNLQLLCADCHHAKTAEKVVPADEEQKKLVKELSDARVKPSVPSRLCDDEVNWATQWRALKKERRSRLLELLGEMGYGLREFTGTSWPEMWDEVLDGDGDGDGEDGYTEDDDSGYGPNSYFAHAMARDD